MSTPLEMLGRLGATARAAVDTSDEMMDKDELEVGGTSLQRCSQPVVLSSAERAIPIVAGHTRSGHGWPKRIQHNEQGVAPVPGVVVLGQPNVRDLRGIARVKAVGNRISKVSCPHAMRPDTHVVGRSVEPPPGLAAHDRVDVVLRLQGRRLRRRRDGSGEVLRQSGSRRLPPRGARPRRRALRAPEPCVSICKIMVNDTSSLSRRWCRCRCDALTSGPGCHG